jgi:hypothetical protein
VARTDGQTQISLRLELPSFDIELYGIMGPPRHTDPSMFVGTHLFVTIKKTVHLIDDECESVRIFFLLRGSLELSPAYGFVK